jgi:hypothetical protein
MIHKTNLVIEGRNATLDVERDNSGSLLNGIQQIPEGWDMILNEAKLVAKNTGISCELPTNCNFPTESDAEQHYKTYVFFVTSDSITVGFTVICKLFGFLWQLNRLSNEDLLSAAEQFQQQYNKDISKDLGDEIIFLRRTYCVNVKLNCKPKGMLQEILKLRLSGVFPNITTAFHTFVSLPASVTSG